MKEGKGGTTGLLEDDALAIMGIRENNRQSWSRRQESLQWMTVVKLEK